MVNVGNDPKWAFRTLNLAGARRAGCLLPLLTYIPVGAVINRPHSVLPCKEPVGAAPRGRPPSINHPTGNP